MAPNPLYTSCLDIQGQPSFAPGCSASVSVERGVLPSKARQGFTLEVTFEADLEGCIGECWVDREGSPLRKKEQHEQQRGMSVFSGGRQGNVLGGEQGE